MPSQDPLTAADHIMLGGLQYKMQDHFCNLG